MSLLKQLGLVKEGKSLHLFWQLFRAARALFVIITLLLVFTKWQLQVLRNTVQSVIARSLGNSKSELWTPISKDIRAGKDKSSWDRRIRFSFFNCC